MNDIRIYAHDSDAHSASEAGAVITACGIIDAERLETSGNILSYVEYLESISPASGGVNVIQGDSETMHGFRYDQEIEQFLNVAVEQDLFEINFQPIYSIDDGRFISMEALSRLRHPSLGPVPPDVFIQIAERSGCIADIGCLQVQASVRVREGIPLKALRYKKYKSKSFTCGVSFAGARRHS